MNLSSLNTLADIALQYAAAMERQRRFRASQHARLALRNARIARIHAERGDVVGYIDFLMMADEERTAARWYRGGMRAWS